MSSDSEKSMKQRWIFVSILVVLTLVLDQASKIMARHYLASQPRISFLGGLFAFDFAENPGAFLSVGSGLSTQMRFLIFSLGVVLVLLWAGYLLVKRIDLQKIEIWGLAFLLAGGIGNLIDRLMKSTVTDFMQMGIGGLYTGIFNIADMAIMVGVIFLMLTSFVSKNKKPKAKIQPRN